jgi:tetratricopeptide (TPR) repeat protein
MVLPMARPLLLAALASALAFAPPVARPQGPQGGAAQARGGPAPAALAPILAEIDASYVKRDEPGQLAIQRARLADAEKLAPGDYEVLWREARLQFWLADDPKLPAPEKSKLGKAAWELGDRATAANPARVEGWHYAAAGVGNYALGIGILTALRQGIEGKFKERLGRAEQIDPGFQDGAIQTAWGRFWYELPWPKYSASRSRASLEAALKRNPDNVRAHVYLAELYLKESQPELARAELQKAVAKAPGRYDAPEERRWQEVARRLLAEQRNAPVRGSEGG